MVDLRPIRLFGAKTFGGIPVIGSVERAKRRHEPRIKKRAL